MTDTLEGFTLMNFEDEVITRPVVQPAPQPTPAPYVAERVTVRHSGITSAKHLMSPPEQWGWEEVRDYVIAAIEARHGQQPRKMQTEHSIFKSFIARWGAQAGPIAKHAFEVCDGMWMNAPISVSRFTKGCDPYFAQVISDRL